MRRELLDELGVSAEGKRSFAPLRMTFGKDYSFN
jgi:hypothetical protein